MTWPDGRGRAGEEPPTVVFPPVRDEPPGIPGLHYMPGSPTLLPGQPDAPEPPRPRRPWPLLAGLAAVAVLAALGVAWTFGRATDPPPRAAPAPTASVTEPVAATTQPEATEDPLPTTPSPSLSVTTPPVVTTPAPPPTTRPAPALVRVPGVVGERRTGAQSELRRAGFEVSVRTVPVTSRRQDRRVLAQLPPAGTPARPGTTVVLLVGERVDDD